MAAAMQTCACCGNRYGQGPSRRDFMTLAGAAGVLAAVPAAPGAAPGK